MLFTVITPCYNGAEFLHRAHESLLRNLMEGIELEWIIVDDCSNDEGASKKVIESICKISPLPISTIFLKRNYYGSQSTYSAARLAKGAYSIILDQDDMLADRALYSFRKYIALYDNHKNFAGVCGRCVNLAGELIGTQPKFDSVLSNEPVIRHLYRIRGEMLQCTKTSLLVDYFSGMQPGYTNGWAWSRIAQKYDYAYISDVVRIYDTTNPTSSSNIGKIRYPEAQCKQLSEYLTYNHQFAVRDPVVFLKLTAQLVRLSLYLRISALDQLRILPFSLWPLFIPAYFAGYAKYRKDMQQMEEGLV